MRNLTRQLKKHYFRENAFNDIQYRSELSGHLFFDDSLNYLNLNYVSEKICSLN